MASETLKVLMVAASLASGGIARHVHDLTEGLEARGHRVDHIVLYDGSRGSMTPPACRDLGMRPGSLLDVVRGVWKLRRAIIAGNYDVAHSHAVHSNLLLRAACSGWMRRPVVVNTVHNTYEGGRSHRLLNRVTSRSADWVVGVSNAVTRGLAEKKEAPWWRLRTIHNGVRPEDFVQAFNNRNRLRSAHAIAASTEVALFVGRLVPAKGVDDLLTAWRVLSSRREAAELWIVGDGPDRSALEGAATHSVRFLGLRDDVPDLMAIADLLVVPSKHEGFGLVVAEGLASSLPIVASDLPVLREVGGDLAKYVPVGDISLLEKTIVDSLDSGRFDGQAQVRRHRATVAFSVASQVQGFLELYKGRAG